MTFEEGQTWKYNTRPGEENSTLIILKAENRDSIGKVIIVCIKGIRLKNPIRQYGKIIQMTYMEEIPYLALTEEAFLNSITSQLSNSNQIAREKIEILKKYKINIDSVSGLVSLPIKDFLNNAEEGINKE